MNKDPIVILSYARTAMGSLQGNLANAKAPELGSTAITAAIEKSNLNNDVIDNVLMGCVLPAGLGQAPARQAALGAKLPLSTPCTTINKMCGSGMEAAILAHDTIAADSADVIVAGGMESMTNAPHLLVNARKGYRLGHQQVFDHMFLDGLEDAYEPGRLMGTFADETAKHFNFSREAQDEFAINSLKRAQKAIDNGNFDNEIASHVITTRKGDSTVCIDEPPQNAKLDKIPLLRPAFSKDGTVTAANSSSIADGAAALVLTRLSTAEKLGVTPIAKILAHARHAQQPNLFTTAPIGAIKQVLDKANLNLKDIDLFEINEAFAVVTMAAIHEFKLSQDIVNIHGGACALGHPIGASGARIIATLLNSLQQHKLKHGVASLCIGGGEATAIAFEIL